MTENTHRVLDTIIKSFAVLATLIGIYMGYQQFISEWQLNNRKPYIELRTKFYIEMLETVSKITYPQSEEQKVKSITRFWQLYVGSSALVEDDEVEEKVNAFSACIKPDKVLCDQLDLEVNSQLLAEAIRSSLLRSWQIEIEEGI